MVRYGGPGWATVQIEPKMTSRAVAIVKDNLIYWDDFFCCAANPPNAPPAVVAVAVVAVSGRQHR